ncbi:hypothetical protein FJZ31_21475 [Candidatus Poribacteria bacterium]|nr:hypothetical protein [Candidatus Poribacteria bacterium]
MGNIRETLIESLQRIEPASDPDISLAFILKSHALEKQRYYRALADYYTKRYEMSPDQFYQERIADKDHSFEDEETYFDWVTALQSINEMEAEIKKLEEIIFDANGHRNFI